MIDKIREKCQNTISDLLPVVDRIERQGVENLNYEDTEDYGVFVGKVELATELLKMIKEED